MSCTYRRVKSINIYMYNHVFFPTTICLSRHISRISPISVLLSLLCEGELTEAGCSCSPKVDISSSNSPSSSCYLIQAIHLCRPYDSPCKWWLILPNLLQAHAYSVGCVQQTLHLGAVLTITILGRSLVIASLLAKEFLDVLDALRLFLVLTHHAEGRREELFAVLHLHAV